MSDYSCYQKSLWLKFLPLLITTYLSEHMNNSVMNISGAAPDITNQAFVSDFRNVSDTTTSTVFDEGVTVKAPAFTNTPAEEFYR